MVDALERYVTYLIAERNVSPYTLRNYRTEIGQFIEYAQSHGVTTWDQVDKALVRRWLAELRGADYVPASIAGACRKSVPVARSWCVKACWSGMCLRVWHCPSSLTSSRGVKLRRGAGHLADAGRDKATRPT